MTGTELVITDSRQNQSILVTPRQIVAAAFRRRRTVGYTFLAIMGGAILAALLLPSKYDAETKILLHRERVDPPLSAQQTGIMQQAAPSLTEEDINSEVGLLQSQDLLERVVVSCGLQHRSKEPILSHLFGWKKLTEDELRARAVAKLRASLRIEPIKKSYLISVSYSATDPQLAARVLNTLNNFYLEKHTAVRRAPGAQDFFEKETESYRQGLQNAENRLAEFNRREGLVTYQTEKEASIPKLAEFELSMRQTEAAIPQLEEHVRSLQAQVANTAPRITTELRNSDNAGLMQQLKSSLVNLELQHTDLVQKYAPDDRQVLEVESQIAQVRSTIEAQEKTPIREEVTNENPTYELLLQELVKAKAEHASMKALSSSYDKVVRSYRDSTIERDQKQLEQQELLRNVKTEEQGYLLYLSKREEARISDAFDLRRIINVSIAQEPTVPVFPSNPASLTLLIAAILGCFLSAGAVVIQEQLDTSLSTPDQVEAYLGIPVLASMPRDGVAIPQLPNSRS
jgi:uncharacterized protein involved in exopolysaccharide biosynthesis